MMKICKKCGKQFEGTARSLFCIQCRRKTKANCQKRQYNQNEEAKEKQKIRARNNQLIQQGKMKMADCCAYPYCRCKEDLQFFYYDWDGEHPEFNVMTLCKKHKREMLEQKNKKGIKNAISISIKKK